MQGFTPVFLDNLSDNALVFLNTLARMAIDTPEGANADQVAISQLNVMVHQLKPNELTGFVQAVSAAVERRFGPVPGYQ